MERGRILILGQSKEHTYGVRNLLDNRKFEIEIALSVDVAKTILTQRYMNLLVLHTEISVEAMKEFFLFIRDRAIDLPLLIFGEETTQYRELIPNWLDVSYFEKPYAADEVYSTIQGLESKTSQAGVGWPLH